jgi:hypothetical protein
MTLDHFARFSVSKLFKKESFRSYPMMTYLHQRFGEEA